MSSNEKTKRHMSDQRTAIYNNLKETFLLPVFEDEIAEDEESKLSNPYHFFIIQSGDILPTESTVKLAQVISVHYYSEERDDVDEKTVEIIAALSPIKGLNFTGSRKERLQAKDTGRFVDWIEISFRRVIPIVC